MRMTGGRTSIAGTSIRFFFNGVGRGKIRTAKTAEKKKKKKTRERKGIHGIKMERVLCTIQVYLLIF